MEPYLLISFPLLLMLSAVFSSSETAFFSLSSYELFQLEEEHPVRGKRVRKLMENTDILLNGILLGNLLVNICATAVATVLLHDYGQSQGWGDQFVYLLDVAGMTLILLIFCEISPKVYAIGDASRLAVRVSWFIRWWLVVMRPFIIVLVWFSTWFKGLFSHGVEDRQMLEDELKLMVDMSAEQGDLEQAEKRIIHNIFELSETMVREIMVPRTDIQGFSLKMPIQEMIETVRDKGYSRYPVYEGDLDNIVGVLYAKDLLDYVYGLKEKDSIQDLLRGEYYVPESKLCGATLREFQEQHVYMGIVVDEYGGTEGLVTVEDIMEEIIGEIQDEHDEEEPLIEARPDGAWLVEGRIDIDDLAEKLGLMLDEKEQGYDSLGGFLLTRIGRLPHPGESIEYGGFAFTVTKVIRRRICQVRIARIAVPENKKTDRKHSKGKPDKFDSRSDST
jgi:magnesium and cobalt exporter, CNNM family